MRNILLYYNIFLLILFRKLGFKITVVFRFFSINNFKFRAHHLLLQSSIQNETTNRLA